MPPTDRTKRIVWGQSGARCAICRESLLERGQIPEMEHLIGEVAHIVAEEQDGPRGESSLSVEQRNSEANLILLCLKHHKIIDDAPKSYPVEALHKTKEIHKKWVDICLAKQPAWKTKLFQLYYINVPRISLMAAQQSASLDLTRYGQIKALNSLGFELVGLMSGFNALLQHIEIKAIPLSSIVDIEGSSGAIVSFNQEFRTKNIKMPEPGKSYETVFSGDLSKDPHVYCTHNDFKVVMNIDRRWVTTSTAFCQFRGGRKKFAGLGVINAVNLTAKTINVTPYVIGMPSNPLIEEFYK